MNEIELGIQKDLAEREAGTRRRGGGKRRKAREGGRF